MFLLPIRSILSGIAGLLTVAGACAVGAPPAMASADSKPDAMLAIPESPVSSPHDFDFELGRWHTTLRRRLRPLSGSDIWAEYAGTTIVRPALDGRANLVELDVSGPRVASKGCRCGSSRPSPSGGRSTSPMRHPARSLLP
jgi:hypothetical protein